MYNRIIQQSRTFACEMKKPPPQYKALNELTVIPSGKGAERRLLLCGIWRILVKQCSDTVIYTGGRLSGWWWDCLFWVTFQRGHRGEVSMSTHSQSECVYVCLCVHVCDSSVCVCGRSGPEQVGSPEAWGSSRQWLGFGVGRALQSVPISLLPPCDIQKTAAAIGTVHFRTRYAHTKTQRHSDVA